MYYIDIGDIKAYIKLYQLMSMISSLIKNVIKIFSDLHFDWFTYIVIDIKVISAIIIYSLLNCQSKSFFNNLI